MRFVLILFSLSICFGLSAQTYDEWIDSSFSYLEKNQLDSAEVALKSALRLESSNPLNPFLLNNLGTIQRRQGKSEDALLSYTAALSTYPRNEVFLDSRASLFAEMGSVENALIDYSTLLEVNPNNLDALYQRGLLYLDIRSFDRSEADFKKMLELDSNSFNGYLGMASYYKISGDYLESERTYNYILDKLPDAAPAYAGRAELYLLQEKPGKAMKDVNKAFDLSENYKSDPFLYIVRAKAKILLHEKENALLDIDRAVELGYAPEKADELRELIR